jgi:hypothetical protein
VACAGDRRGVEAVLARTKAARPLPNGTGVTLPGERGTRLAGVSADLQQSCVACLHSESLASNLLLPHVTVENQDADDPLCKIAAARQAANSIPVPRQLLRDLEALAARGPAAAEAATSPASAQAGQVHVAAPCPDP